MLIHVLCGWYHAGHMFTSNSDAAIVHKKESGGAGQQQPSVGS